MASDCNRVYRVLQGTGYYNILQSAGLHWGILGGRGYGGTVATAGYWGNCGVLRVLGSNWGYWWLIIMVTDVQTLSILC